MPQERITTDEFQKRYGSLEHLKPPDTTGVETLTPTEFNKRYKGVSPKQVTPKKPPSPAEDSITDLEIGTSLGIGGLNALRALAQVPRAVGALTPPTVMHPTLGRELQDISEGLTYLVGKIPRPKKEKPLPPAQSIKEVLTSPRRLAEGAIENLPLMGVFMAAFVANPVAGTALIAATEGGEAARELDEWEKDTGNVLPPGTKALVVATVGGINAALERIGISRILKAAGGRGLLKRFTQSLIAAPVEGGTEFLQEWTQILAKAGYADAEDVLTNMWKALKSPQNLVRAGEAGAIGTVLGGGISAALPRGAEEVVPPTPEVVAPEVETRERMEQLEKEGAFPKLETSEDALAYGTLNIKDEDVEAWKAKVVELQGEIDEARLQNINPLTKEIEPFKVGDFIAQQGKAPFEVIGLSTVEKTIDVAIRYAEENNNRPVVEILNMLKPILPVGAQTLQADKISGAYGLYDADSNAVIFGRENFKQYMRGTEKITDKVLNTITHELLHFGTIYPFKAARASLSESEARFVDQVSRLRIQAATFIAEIADENIEALISGTGLVSDEEFVTFGLTNPDFQKFLKEVKAEGVEEKTVWQSLIDAIAEFLGFTGETTVLEQLVNATGEYLSTRRTGIAIEQATQLQMYKDALGAKLDANIQYDPVRGFIQTPLTDSDYEAIVGAISGQDAETRLSWAKEQVDKSEWLKWFAGKAPPPVDFDVNAGSDIFGTMMGDRGNPPGTTDEDLEVEYSKPKHIKWLSQRIFTPEFLLKKRKSLKDASAVIKGEFNLNHKIRNYEVWYKKLMYKMKKEERELVRKAMERAYVALDPNAQTVSILSAQQDLAEMYAKHPRLKRVIEGVDSRGGIIQLFEYVKDRYQKSLIRKARFKLTEVDNQILDVLLDGQGNLQERAEVQVERLLDIEGISKKEFDERHTEGAWVNAKEKVRNKKRDTVVRREGRRLVREAKEIIEIKGWGLQEYITNIELGSYRILDDEGNTLGFGKTAKEAKAKAYQLRQEMKGRGEVVKKLKVEASFSPVKPTEKRKDVLAGMKDIFEVLPRYIYAMEKRIIMQPIIDQYKRNAKEDPKEYSADVRNIIQTQIDYVMGAKYSWGDMIADDIAKAFGWETGKYSRGVGLARKWWARAKLGYRPTAALVNAMGGFGNTWVAVGNEFFVKGRKIWKSGKYVDPETGEVIDFAKKLKEVEDVGGLAIDFAVGEGGEIQTRIPIWQPLGLFQLPERFIRPHGFAANYVYQRERLGKNDQEATEAALLNLRFQNFAYNLSAIPHILRSPTARIIGQFKTYLIGQLQYMSTLRGEQIARMVGLQLMMAGPRGVVYMLKSIPILASLGMLDDLEEFLVRQKGIIGDVLTRGVGGLAGVDISAPATFQLPNRPEDWGGPFLSDMIDFYKKVLIPAMQAGMSKVTGHPAPAYMFDEVVDWVGSLSPMITYWKDLDSSVMVWDEVLKGKFSKAYQNLKENYRKPNVWVRDSAGNKAYQVGGLWDRTMLLIGAPPTEKTQYQVLKSVWIKNMAIRADNRSKWYNKVTKTLLRGLEVDQDLWRDAILYGVDPKQIPTAIQYKEMTPQQRETMRARLFDKAEALDHFGLEK